MPTSHVNHLGSFENNVSTRALLSVSYPLDVKMGTGNSIFKSSPGVSNIQPRLITTCVEWGKKKKTLPFQTEQDPMVFAPSPPPSRVLCLPFVCGKLKSKNTFNQRNENIKKQRKTVKGDQIIIMYSLSVVKDL